MDSRASIEAVLKEDSKTQALDDKTAHTQIRALVALMLTDDDQETLTKVAAESLSPASVLEAGKADFLSTVTA